MKKRRFCRALVAGITLLSLLSVFALQAGAISAWPRDDVGDRIHNRYENIPATTEKGIRIGDCRLINETTYAPLRAFSDALIPNAKISFDPKTRTASVSADGIWMSAADNAHYLVANGRYLYTDTPILILDDGRTYVPIRLLARALGVDILWDSRTRSVTVEGKLDPILSGREFYREDEVYWLSRIISAESQGEPLLGQIAVGNVVLNRMRSPEYPNTIYGVIFDRRGGVQFSPVLNGSVYREPYYLSIVAAKLCLEGVTVSEDVLFFYAPHLATSFWIPNNRPYAFRIGTHHFFR